MVAPVDLTRLTKVLDSDFHYVDSALRWQKELLGDLELKINDIETHVRQGLTEARDALKKGPEEQGNALKVCEKLTQVIHSFEDVKAKRRIVEYTELSRWGKIKKVFWEYLPRVFGGGYTYIQSKDPIENWAQTATEVNATIQNLYINLYISSAPKGEPPEEILSKNIFGVDVQKGEVWVKKAGSGESIRYPSKIRGDGIVLREGEKEVVCPTWIDVMKRVQEISNIGDLTDIDAAREKGKEALAQYCVGLKRDLTESEWVVEKDGQNYKLRQKNKETLFSITADGRFKKGMETPVNTFKELFPELNIEDCLAHKYRAAREATAHQIVEKGVLVSEIGPENKTLIFPGGRCTLSEVLKKDSCSFFVAKSGTKGVYISYTPGKVESTPYEILENGTLSPPELQNKLNEPILAPANQLWKEIETRKIHALAEKQEDQGGFAFTKGYPEGRVEQFLELIEKMGGEYKVEVFTSPGPKFVDISINQGVLFVSPLDKGLQPVTARTVEELKEKIKSELPNIGGWDFLAFTSDYIKGKKYDQKADSTTLATVCTALKGENPHPWLITPPMNTEGPIVISHGVDLKQQFTITAIKQEGKWYLRTEKGLFNTIEEVVAAHGLRQEDSVHNLLQRKTNYDSLVPELTGDKRSLLRFKWSKEHDFFAGKKSTPSEQKDLIKQLENKAKSARNPVAAVYEDNGAYFLLISTHQGKTRTVPITIETTPVPNLVCEGRRGTTLGSVLPEGVTSMAGARIYVARAKADDEFFAVAGQTYFTDCSSFQEVEERIRPFREKMPKGRRFVALFRDPGHNICCYTITANGSIKKYYVEQDGEAIDLYADAAKENWREQSYTFSDYCHRTGSLALSLGQLEALSKAPVKPVFSPTDFGKFFVPEKSYEDVSNKLKSISAKVPEERRVISVFEQDGSYYLCSLRAGREEPQIRLLAKNDDGSLSLRLQGGKEKEKFTSFKDLCAKLKAMTFNEAAKLPVRAAKPSPAPAPAVSGEIEWASWLDDPSDPISDGEAKQKFPTLIQKAGALTLPHEFRVWVKGLAIARTQAEMDMISDAKKRMQQFPIVDQFWFYELSLGATVVKEGTNRQKQAITITSEVLQESLKDESKKKALLTYFEHNKDAYGPVLSDLLEPIKAAFSPEERKRVGLK